MRGGKQDVLLLAVVLTLSSSPEMEDSLMEDLENSMDCLTTQVEPLQTLSDSTKESSMVAAVRRAARSWEKQGHQSNLTADKAEMASIGQKGGKEDISSNLVIQTKLGVSLPPNVVSSNSAPGSPVSFWHYYEDLPPLADGGLVADFQEMDAEDLVHLAQALEENTLQDVQQTQSLVYAHYYIFLKTGKLGDLEESINTLQNHLNKTNSTDPNHIPLLRGLIVMLSKKFRVTGSISDLDAATHRARDLLGITDLLHPERYWRWLGLATLLAVGATTTKNRAAFDDLIEDANRTIEDAMPYLPTDGEDKYLPGDRTLPMKRLKKALGVTPPDHHTRDVWLDKFVDFALLNWQNYDQDLAGLEEAILLGEKASFADSDDRRKAWRLFCLGNCLIIRFNKHHNIEDLNAGIRKIEQAIITSSDDRPERLLRLHDFLQLRFQETDQILNLERACRIMEEILNKLPLGHPGRPLQQDIISNHLVSLFLHKRTMTPQDLEQLDRAISLNSEVYSYIEDHPDHSEAPRWLNNYATHLSLRFDIKGTVSDLRLAGQFYYKAVNPPYQRDENRPRYLAGLVINLIKMFQCFGNVDDLDQAILAGKEALVDSPNNFAEKSHVLNAIRSALTNKFVATGNESLLQDAVEWGKNAVVAAVSSTAPETSLWLNNLAETYLRLYACTHNTEDIDNSITLLEQAIVRTRDENDVRPLLLTRLAQCLLARFNHQKNTQDLNISIHYMEEAVSTPTTQPHFIKAQMDIILAQLLSTRYMQTGILADIDWAIALSRKASEELPTDSPLAAEFMYNVAEQLERRYSQSRNISDLIEAAVTAEAGASHELSPAHMRILCAVVAINSLYQLHKLENAVEVAGKAIFMLPRVSPRTLRHSDQRHMLERFSGLVAMAVAAALAVNQSTEHCLEMLEFGRGIINGLRFDSQIDLTILAGKRPDLAAEFVYIQNQLDPPVSLSRQGNMTEPAVKVDLDAKHKLTREFDDVVHQIREVEGFEMFLELPQAKILKKVSTSPREAVVIINPAFRCDAFLVHNGNIDHLHLPKLRLKDIEKSVSEIETMRRGVGTNTQHSRKLSRILAWLWTSLVSPVLDELGFGTKSVHEEWPRVWWVPTGLLSQLPLHAAGYHLPGQSISTLDRVISSYSSSIRALMYSRQNQRARDLKEPGNSIILAYMQNSEGASKLEYARDEIDELVKLLPPIANHITLPEPTKEELLGHLKTCEIFHFAGHGTADPLNPLNSRLLLEGDGKTNPLTVKDLISLNLHKESPWLAYLSACSTGETQDDGLNDESIHLMAAYHLAGFQNVVGSLWEISERFSVDVAKEVYNVIKDSIGIGTTGEVALAVHTAVRHLRAQTFVLREQQKKVGTTENDLSEEDSEPDEDDSRGIRNPEVKAMLSKSNPLIWASYIHVGL
jgi:CHAT domain-containing protein/tetratricopeptide (TPR) repeat protein